MPGLVDLEDSAAAVVGLALTGAGAAPGLEVRGIVPGVTPGAGVPGFAGAATGFPGAGGYGFE